jgi:hypothetical protein
MPCLDPLASPVGARPTSGKAGLVALAAGFLAGGFVGGDGGTFIRSAPTHRVIAARVAQWMVDIPTRGCGTILEASTLRAALAALLLLRRA